MNRMIRLNRYTTLPVLLDMLKRRKLVLLDPASWEDRNDAELLIEYKKRKKLKSLLALCLSYGDETIHHWKTFADGISGCCIEFDAKKLISLLKPISGVRFGPIVYRKLHEVKNNAITVGRIPFTKRWPYRCEEEFRILWEHDAPVETFEIPFDLRIIRKITINQRMPKPVYFTIREELRGVFKDPEQRINRSTIYQNQIWIDKFRAR
jgi:hypothetical protein